MAAVTRQARHAMDLKQFEAFHVIATTGSFSLAAEQLNVTQSALSHQIGNLERELGSRLLVRARPHVYPTESGRLLLASIGRVLDELKGIRQQFGIAGGTEAIGTLRIAATYSGLTYLYGDLCEEFMRRYPAIDLVFTATQAPDDAVVRVVTRAADLAFSPLPVESQGLTTRLLGSIEQVFVVSRRHELARRRTVSVAELRRWPFLRFQPRTGSRALSDEVFLGDGGYPPVDLELNDTEFMKRMVAMGSSVALVPAFMIGRELRDGTLKALRLQGRRLSQDVGLVFPAGAAPKSRELFESVCLDMRGPRPWNFTLERVAAARPARRKEAG